ncbi:HutD/Ves family protein [Pseudomonas sp. S9]|uniref:HutD/Ves family protein n=1 Tax=Pseudomonas sp. S9 TaxID=686578 RepID=UPI00025567F6|nr:HutD family protein [Pseudomonas sp. S9]
MSIRRIGLATAKHMPWKNGAGSTAELAIFPVDAQLNDFAWRISSARVGADGAFSSFIGLDRSLAILSGAGLRLSCQGSAPKLLTLASEPWSFRGETPIYAELIDGEVTDFNLISRRADWTHQLQMLEIIEGHNLPATEQATVLMIYCHSGGPLRCQTSSAQHLLAPGEGLLLDEADAGQALDISAQSPGKLYIAYLKNLAE